MGIRVRGIIALVLLMLVFVNINTFTQPDAGQRALAEPPTTGSHSFGDDSGSDNQQVLSTPSTAPTFHARPPIKADPLQISEDPKEVPRPRPQTHHGHTTATTNLSAATPSISPTSAKQSDDIRLLIGVMSPFWASSK